MKHLPKREPRRGGNEKFFPLIIFPILFLATACQAESMLGFDLNEAIIPVEEIHHGGPPPDGIPSIDEPRFTTAGEVDFLRDDDLVLGVIRGDDARAYPFRILIWHEIVNDTVRFRFEKDAGRFTIYDKSGDPLPAVHVFWFAWQAFYPETDLWTGASE